MTKLKETTIDWVLEDFILTLKKHKLYKHFCLNYKLADRRLRGSWGYLPIFKIGSLRINGQGIFYQKLAYIYDRILPNSYYPNSWLVVPKENFLYYYTKEYFTNRKINAHNNLLFYQLIFGSSSVALGLILFFCLIFYFWGAMVSLVVATVILISSILTLEICYCFLSKEDLKLVFQLFNAPSQLVGLSKLNTKES